MRRWALTAILAAACGSSGCTLCQNCDYYNGSYYGGLVGDWNHNGPRAGSAYAGTADVAAETASGYEPVAE